MSFSPLQSFSRRLPALLALLLFLVQTSGGGQHNPNLDKRQPNTGNPELEPQKAATHLAELLPGATIQFDPIVGSPKWISSRDGFLSGRNGVGKAITPQAHRGIHPADPHSAIKAFLNEHAKLFGHDSTALHRARVGRDFTSAHNGLRTAVWEQELDGIPVFQAALIGHITAAGELVNISSRFLPQLNNIKRHPLTPQLAKLSAAKAVLLAAANLGLPLLENDLVAAVSNNQPTHQFTAQAAKGPIHVQLKWLPLDPANLRLCWEVILIQRKDGVSFRLLVDVDSGEILIRHCLTSSISDASYRVFTGDSPSPMSPSLSTPSTVQPALVSRSFVVTPALNTNASPNGWINDGVNETRGNNVDAHLDRLPDDQPDLPRPQGSPNRVFDFPLDLGQNPFNFGNAAVVNAFYWCNWYHDKLYEFGFTEAAGNFQLTNLGRGGIEGDPIMADVQDGSGRNNAQFTTWPDGASGRLQIYIFDGPEPDRDGAYDTEIILHELTHGLSNRRVGGGVGLTASQSLGLGEGWSDFYSLALLSEPSDDINANYAIGGYSAYLLSNLGISLTNNYYFGIRRYPYSTDMTRNPLTFKDIDPTQANPHSGIPKSPIFATSLPNQIHAQGEVWAVTLWEARANLINKYGFAAGNRLIIQLVTDGMNLTPPDPNFIQARDGILQADMINHSGANFRELWAAFAKRGMGFSASAGSSSVNTNIHEAFDSPDDLLVSPRLPVISIGEPEGPFSPASQLYTLTNIISTNFLPWSVAKNVTWISISNASGTLSPGNQSALVTANLNNKASLLPAGLYNATLTFSNHASGRVQGRLFALRIGQPDYLTEVFDSDNDLAFQSWTFVPDGSGSFYTVCREPVSSFPTDPRDGKAIALGDDSFTQITLADSPRVSLYGKSTNIFFIGSNGYITFESGDSVPEVLASTHFNRPRVSALFQDLNPAAGGRVSWQQLGDRIAVTFENVPEFEKNNSNSFQFELFYDGRIRLTYLAVAARGGIVGLSQGGGLPPAFVESDFNSYPSCSSRLTLLLPDSATEGAGTLSLQGQVWLPFPTSTNLSVTLKSGDVSELTVPSLITIPAGQSNAFFDLLVVDDNILDGTEIVPISADAPQYLGAKLPISIHDNEAATLSLTLPDTLLESAGNLVAGLSVSAPVAAEVTVVLGSSAPDRISLPASVIVPAGSSSVPVPITIVNNSIIDGAASVTLTARVQNWSDAVRVIQIVDDEAPILSLAVPSIAIEAAGTLYGSGSISLPGVLPTNLVISLSSANQNRLTVPPSLILPAGRSNVTFNISSLDNTVADGNETIQISVAAPGFSSASANVIVADDETPPVPSAPLPADLSTGRPLELDLQWSASQGTATYSVYFGTTPALGPSQLLGSTTNRFWHVAGLLPQTPYFWKVVAQSLGQSVSPVWQFLTAGADHFTISTPAGQQRVGQPFTLSVTARDPANGIVTNFAGSIDLDAFFGPPPIPVFSEDFESAVLRDWTTNAVVSASLTDATSAQGTKSLLLAGGSGQPTNGISRRFPNLKPTTVSFAAKASSGASPGGTLLISSGPGVQNAVTLFEFSSNGTMGITDGFGGAYFVSYESNVWYLITLHLDWARRTVDFYVNDTLIEQSVPFRGATASSISTIYLYNQGNTASWWDKIEFLDDYSGIVSASPATITDFVNGVWTGQVTIHQSRLAVTMQASDAIGHQGFSEPFDVLASNDLLLDATTSSNPLLVGEELEYTVRVINPGPSDATGLVVRTTWSFPVSIFSSSSTLGSCVTTSTNVICDIGMLSAGESATLSIALSVSTPGILTNISILTRDAIDPNPVNDSRTTIIEVIPARTLAIGDSSVVEGDFGYSNALVELQLSGVSQFPVTATYLAFPDSAAASDFIPATGTVLLMPGSTNAFIQVPVTNDRIQESNETFQVLLTSARNASLIDNVGIVTIIDNDPPPHLTISDAIVMEASSEPLEGRLLLSLDQPSGLPVQVNFSTANGTAISGNDYLATNGAVTIPAGQTNAWVGVLITSDSVVETNEFFIVNLTLPLNALLSRTQAQAIIVDGDAPPCVTIDDIVITETDSGSETMFTVSLSRAHWQPVFVAYRTQDGTAVVSEDYLDNYGVITFDPGVVTQPIVISLPGDLKNELEEFFSVSLIAATNAAICKAQGLARIIDNDPLPQIRGFGSVLQEGDLGSTTAWVPVSLSSPASRPISINFATADRTAQAGSDYIATNGLLIFPAGVTSNAIPVTILGEAAVESDEMFLVQFSRPTNAILQTSSAAVTILDDDGKPGFLNHFDWSNVPSPQAPATPFPVSLAARDAFGNTVTSFNGLARISGRVVEPVISVGSGSASSAHPMSAFFRIGRTQVIYLASELGQASQFTSLALQIAAPPGQALNNWTIRLKQTSLAGYSAPATWHAAGWTAVYQTNQPVASNGWLIFPFSSPFPYNGVDNLLVDFSFNNSSFSFDGLCRGMTTAQPRMLALGTDSGADPLGWNGASPVPVMHSFVPNLRLSTLCPPVALQPEVVSFFGGLWSGNIQVQSSVTNIFLSADDQSGHSGQGNLFNVSTAPEHPPLIVSLLRDGGVIELLWPSQSGRVYRVEYKNTLDEDWTPIPGNINATGATSSKVDPSPSPNQRFYQVILLPPP